VDDLLVELEKNKKDSGLLYMDDLATVNCTYKTLITTHTTILTWCAIWDATINLSKLEMLQNGMEKEMKEFAKATGMSVKDIKVFSLKYLGITTTKDAGTPKGWDAHSKKTGEKMLAAFYLAGRKGMIWNARAALTGYKLFQCILDRIGLYGEELWDHNESQSEKMDKIRAQILKATLGLHPSTPTKWVLWETNTLPTGIALDASKARAWRSWKEKETEGQCIPPYVQEITRKALDRLGYKKSKWINTPLNEFPGKKKWGILVQEWAQKEAALAFEEWWTNAQETKELSTEVDYLALKDTWGDTEEFILEVREHMGHRMSTFLRARANAIGFKCDNTVRKQTQIQAHKKICRKCWENEETLVHVWTQCSGHDIHRAPLRQAIWDLPPEERQFWKEHGASDQAFVETMLQEPSHKITKIGIQCLQNMLDDLEIY
jgi:hypothetical protein